jgi:hypothetical protein
MRIKHESAVARGGLCNFPPALRVWDVESRAQSPCFTPRHQACCETSEDHGRGRPIPPWHVLGLRLVDEAWTARCLV